MTTVIWTLFLFACIAQSSSTLQGTSHSKSFSDALQRMRDKEVHDQFKTFEQAKDIKTVSRCRSSEQRKFRTLLQECYPLLSAFLEGVGTEDKPFFLLKTTSKLSLLVVDGSPLFFEFDEHCFLPTLRLLHRLPQDVKLLQEAWVDEGAVRHILNGATIMAPGVRKMDEMSSCSLVVVRVEEKKFAIALGYTLQSSEEVLTNRKGPAINVLHRLNDGLWKLEHVRT